MEPLSNSPGQRPNKTKSSVKTKGCAETQMFSKALAIRLSVISLLHSLILPTVLAMTPQEKNELR